MVFLYVLIVIIPIMIFLDSFKTIDIRIKKCRLKYSIMSLLSVIYDGVLVVLVIMKYVSKNSNHYYVTIVPFVLFFLSFLSYQIGRKKERRIQADILAENAIDIMDLRKQNAFKNRL